ncbi:hypothetical protein F2P56_001307 [Juglans regia]|uniref:E3 ubiquitin-protein ligase RGLG4-like n=1 Tax=Juglans regia TaxID=51240 RepID=A0A833Y9X5_JUGRE|nr:hypothetical protein F2P56_001307 [Juglans regia]
MQSTPSGEWISDSILPIELFLFHCGQKYDTFFFFNFIFYSLVQFVDFTKVMSENTDALKKEAAFALAALMEIPLQFRATQRLVNRESGAAPRTRPLPPPRNVIDHDNAVKSVPPVTDFKTVEATAQVELVCPICLTNPKDMAFGCGHLVSSSKLCFLV